MTYKNSFHKPKYQDSKPEIEIKSVPVEYKDYLIYKRSNVFDIVKDGVCIGMYAGINGAKKRIDELNELLKLQKIKEEVWECGN